MWLICALKLTIYHLKACANISHITAIISLHNAYADMMTKDAVTVTVDAISFMKVQDPIKAILEVDDYRYAFKVRSYTQNNICACAYTI